MSIIFCGAILLLVLVSTLTGSELSTYAKQNCLLIPVPGNYDCDITSNPLLFKYSLLPGDGDVVHISQASGLRFSVGKDSAFSGLVLSATDTHFLVEPGAQLNITGPLVVGANATMEVVGIMLSKFSTNLQKNGRLDVRGIASFGTELTAAPDSQVNVFSDGKLQINASSTLLGNLQLQTASLLEVTNGTTSFSAPFMATGNVAIWADGAIATPHYSQSSGILKLTGGRVLSPITFISANATITGNGSLAGNLVLNGSLDFVLGSNEAYLNPVVVKNVSYIGDGGLTVFVTDDKLKPHTHTYTMLTSKKLEGKFQFTFFGPWFKNTTTKLKYTEGSVSLLVSRGVRSGGGGWGLGYLVVVAVVFLLVNR